jgi:hypothetical protein
VAALGVDERARHEAPLIEGEAVAGEGELVLGAALDVLEGEVRDAPRRNPAQLLDRERAPEVAARVIAALDRRLSR